MLYYGFPPITCGGRNGHGIKTKEGTELAIFELNIMGEFNH
jgi:hypothetical protein